MWELKRREQFVILQDIINQLESLDRGSHAISKLPNMIKAAKSLTDWNGKELQKSFLSFLEEEATK